MLISECHKPRKLVKVLNQGDFSGEELEVLPSSQSTPSAPPPSPASNVHEETDSADDGEIELDDGGRWRRQQQDDKSDSASVSAMSNSGDDRKMLTCFYRDVPYNGNMFSFVYIKRLDKRVNFHVERIPYLINKLCYYYSIKGKDLEKMKKSLEKSVRLINDAMAEVNESDLDIPDGC